MFIKREATVKYHIQDRSFRLDIVGQGFKMSRLNPYESIMTEAEVWRHLRSKQDVFKANRDTASAFPETSMTSRNIFIFIYHIFIKYNNNNGPCVLLYLIL